MRGSVRSRGVLALLAGLVLLGAGAWAEGPHVNGLSQVVPMASVGALQATAPNGCVVSYTATVLADNVGGEDAFQLQVVDDGAIVQIETLTVPADGAVHTVSGSFKLKKAPLSESPGIGLYLADGAQLFDAVDPLEIPCRAFEPEVPTLAGAGSAALVGVLALAAVVLLRRSRAAA